MIIFGWGRKTLRNLGSAMPLKCKSCSSNNYWNLIRARVWFSLFFIPIIPYESAYFLQCNQCKVSFKLDGYNIDKAKKMNLLTNSFINHEIPEEEYNRLLEIYRVLPGIDDPNKTWECYKCGHVNPNNTYKCLGCGLRLR